MPVPQIVVEDLVKTFPVAERDPGLWGAFRGVVKRRYRNVHALSGISFSLNRRGPVLTTLAVLAIVLVVLFVAAQALPGLPTVGFALLLGGGVSNEINRLLSVPHRVTDFISVGWFTVFNLADVAVTIGFGLLMVALVRGSSLVEW